MILTCTSTCFSLAIISLNAQSERSIALIVPAAYHNTKLHRHSFNGGVEDAIEDGLKVISHGASALLLIVYIAYLGFHVRVQIF